MKIIATRNAGRNPETGFLKPVYVMKEQGNWERVGSAELRSEKFPNSGTVVVPRKFHEISDNYDPHEFLYVDIELSTNYEEFIPNSCKFDADSRNVSKLPMLIQGTFSPAGTVELPYSGHRYVFYQDGDFIYGPVSIYQSDQIEGENYYTYTKEPLNTSDLNLDDQYAGVVFKYYRSALELRLIKNQYGIDGEEEYVFGVEEIVKTITPSEYILTESDEEIREWSYTAFPENFSFDKLQDWLSANDGLSVVDRMRFERFVQLKEKTTAWIKFVDSYLSRHYLQSQEGQQYIDQYIKNNTEDLIARYEKQFKEEAQEKMKEIVDEMHNLELSTQQSQAKKAALQEEIKQLQNEKEVLYSKSEQLKEIESQIQEKYSRLNLANDYERAKNEYEQTLQTITRLSKSLDDKKQELEELQDEYTQEAKKGTHKKMLELMPYVQALTGYYPDDLTGAKQQPLNTNISKQLLDHPVDLDSYILTSKAYLEANGRSFTEIEVANLLTCVHQNFLTIFSGLPGVGKSSLSRLLGLLIAPLGLSLEIPVGRGWSSKKNLLGFYNSLKSEYQADEFGILERLQFISEDDQMVRDLPFILLLDEANLSPIEHYWADFLGVCDQLVDRVVRINNPNGKSEIRLPDGFRFIFTVNNDHTTEILSPRLIDRASIIKLAYDTTKNTELNFPGADGGKEFNHYANSSIKNTFLPITYSLNQAEKRLFNDIIAILGDKDVKLGKQVPVSPRKMKAVSLYCSVIRKFFNKNHENQFLALDYAIVQNVLPLINGHGKNFEQRLEKAKAECLKRSLTQTADQLEEIIGRGKEFQNYSFF